MRAVVVSRVSVCDNNAKEISYGVWKETADKYFDLK
jgi:hypothetical protein